MGPNNVGNKLYVPSYIHSCLKLHVVRESSSWSLVVPSSRRNNSSFRCCSVCFSGKNDCLVPVIFPLEFILEVSTLRRYHAFPIPVNFSTLSPSIRHPVPWIGINEFRMTGLYTADAGWRCWGSIISMHVRDPFILSQKTSTSHPTSPVAQIWIYQRLESIQPSNEEMNLHHGNYKAMQGCGRVLEFKRLTKRHISRVCLLWEFIDYFKDDFLSASRQIFRRE